jgi:hypothetical protein
MIVVLDTNTLFGDPLARGPAISAVLDHARAHDDFTVWLPEGVVAELSRQYSSRVAAIGSSLKKAQAELTTLGLEKSLNLEVDPDALEQYEPSVRSRFERAGATIAAHPRAAATIIEWAARRRRPIRESVTAGEAPEGAASSLGRKPKSQALHGVVDAAIWLTVLEAAAVDSVAFVTSNKKDFCAEGSSTQLHPDLVADVPDDANAITIFPGLTQLRETHIGGYTDVVRPLKGAAEKTADTASPVEPEAPGGDPLADPILNDAVKSALSDAVEWFEIHSDADWGLGVEVDDSVLASFDVEDVQVLRHGEGPSGRYLVVEAEGVAQLELGIRRYDAAQIGDDSPVSILDWEWNESMTLAAAEVQGRLFAEVLVELNGDVAVSLESVEPL